MPHLTDRMVKELPLPDRDSRVIFDDTVKGIGVRITAKGARTFIFVYRCGGRQRRHRIGFLGAWDTRRARQFAARLKREIAAGIDPMDAHTVSLEQHITRKALDFLKRDDEPECYLYRHYHPNGDLLYVGISLEPLRRQDRHLKEADWRSMICRILIEPFKTREQALAAEELAIRTEFPKYNFRHNERHHPLEEFRLLTPQPAPRAKLIPS